MTMRIKVDGTDRSSLIRLETVMLGGQAHAGESADGGFDLEDLTASRSFPGRKVVTLEEDASGSWKTLARGRVVVKDLSRTPPAVNAVRKFGINIVDSNTDLHGLLLRGQARPAETDYARLQWLRGYLLNGSSSSVTNAAKRASTVIDTTTYVPNTHTVTMEANTYDGVDPWAVVDDCARAAGKEYFVIVDDAGAMFLWCDLPTATSYASTLAITDSSPDLVTSFPPIPEGAMGTQDATEQLSGGMLTYGAGSSVYVARPGIAAVYEVWEDAVTDGNAQTSADALVRLNAELDRQQNEELRYRCAVDLPTAKAHLIKYGMTIAFRSAAAGVTSPLTVRVARSMLEPKGIGVHRLHLELGFPEKIRARIQNHKLGQVIASKAIGDAITAGLLIAECHPRTEVPTGSENWTWDGAGSTYTLHAANAYSGHDELVTGAEVQCGTAGTPGGGAEGTTCYDRVTNDGGTPDFVASPGAYVDLTDGWLWPFWNEYSGYFGQLIVVWENSAGSPIAYEGMGAVILSTTSIPGAWHQLSPGSSLTQAPAGTARFSLRVVACAAGGIPYTLGSPGPGRTYWRDQWAITFGNVTPRTGECYQEDE